MPATEDFRTLYCDPGEDFGWAVACGFVLLARGTEKMWETVDNIGDDVEGSPSMFNDADSAYAYDGRDASLYKLPIRRIVCEDFRIYPWKIKALKFNPVRTARAIGAITYICRRNGIEFVLQPAAIKDAAQKAGADELYDFPLKENRHSNDALQHFTYYTQSVLRGANIPVPNEGVQGLDDGGVDD